MKLSRLEIDGFRCFRDRRAVELKEGRSLCLLAENGRGKTSIADALEFWSTGDVGWTHREGVGLGSLIHLDRDEATVEVRVDGVGMASRRLRGNTPGDLEASGPLAVNFEVERLPVLSFEGSPPARSSKQSLAARMNWPSGRLLPLRAFRPARY